MTHINPRESISREKISAKTRNFTIFSPFYHSWFGKNLYQDYWLCEVNQRLVHIDLIYSTVERFVRVSGFLALVLVRWEIIIFSAGHNYPKITDNHPRSAPPGWDVGLERGQLPSRQLYSRDIHPGQFCIHSLYAWWSSWGSYVTAEREITACHFRRSLICLGPIFHLQITKACPVTGDYLQAFWLLILLVGLSE